MNSHEPTKARIWVTSRRCRRPWKQRRLFVELLEARRLLDGDASDLTAPYLPQDEGDPDSEINYGSGALVAVPGLDPGAVGSNLSVGLLGNEPTIAVNPLNANDIAVAQYNNGLQTIKISTDGGTTFPIQQNAVLPTGQTGFSGDDSLAFDAQGRLFWSFLTNPGTSTINVISQQVNPTTGALIGSPAFVTPTVGSLDKEWIAADHNPASPFANDLYAVWTDFSQNNTSPIRFARSTNQGVTWTTLSGNISASGEGFTWPPDVTTAPNGDVYVAWHTNTGGGTGTLGEIRMRRSTDGGLTFGPELIPFTAGTADTTTNVNTPRISGLNVWLQGSQQPQILADPTRPGNIYVVGVDNPSNTYTATGDPSDIVLARSTDNGATWARSTISHGPAGSIQIMPAAAIDASGNITVTWYDNRRGLTNASGDYLLDVYTTTSADGGQTFGNDYRINNAPFNPDIGSPDRFAPNHVLRIGEYNGVASAGGTATTVWTGNSNTGQQILFNSFPIGFQVVSETPTTGQLLTTPTTDFTFQLTHPVDSAHAPASALVVNGIPANSDVLNAAGDTITFHYNTSPVTQEGLQTMSLAAGALARVGDLAPLLSFSTTFNYDPQPLIVTATTPQNGGLASVPLTTLTVSFNEPINPVTANTGNLTLSQGTVTGFTVLPGNQAVAYTLAGVTTEGTLTVSLAAGSLNDANGNPMLAYSGTLQIDVGTTGYPTSLVAEKPAGSLIYDLPEPGLINFAGDTDSYTLAVDSGQTISVRVDPTTPGPATLAPSVQLFDPTSTLAGSATASVGKRALTQAVPVSAGGTYTITVGGTGGTVGSYTLQVFLNAVVEAESNDGASNNSTATAQNLDPSMLGVSAGTAGAQRAAVVGQLAGNDDFYSFSLAVGQSASLALTTGVNSPFSNPGNVYFGSRTDYSGLDGPTSIAYADLNKDGNLDLVSVNNANSDTTLGVRLGFGNGTFGPLVLYPAGGTNPRYAAVGDINGDGNPDIAVSNQSSSTVSVLLGKGDGTFGLASTYAVGSGPFGLIMADLNKDGRADVIVANSNNNTVSVLLGQANGTLGLPSTVAVGTFPTTLAAGDLNNDGRMDVVATNFNSNTISVLLGNGVGGFSSVTSVNAQTNPFGVALADFNGDGKPDVVVANQGSNSLSLYPGDGLGGLGAPATIPLNGNGDGSGPRSVAVGDVNGDGKVDIATANVNSATASVLLGNGNGTFGAPVTFATASSPNSVALVDVNNDGLPDLSTADFGGSSVSIRLNTFFQTTLQLIAPDGTTILKTGTATSSLAADINNFVASNAGTYYARLTGIGSTGYDLVVTRGAAFDAEPNDSFATAQDITGSSGVLGDVTAGAAAPSVVPAALAGVETFSGNAYPFDLAPFNIGSMRYQQIYSNTEFTQSGIIDAIRFRRSSGQVPFTSTPIDVKITLGYSARTVASASSNFATNIGAGTVTVFDGLLSLSSLGLSSSPQPFDIILDVNNLFNYDPTKGDLLLDITVRNSPTASFFAVPQLGQELTTTRIYDFDANSTAGTVGLGASDSRPYGLITRFDFVSPPNDDWYSLNLVGPGHTLSIGTSTPGDGANLFVNTLVPKIELYDPSGNLIATGTVGSDGRNETIRYVELAPGAYRIHVAALGGTTGEYFLGVVAQELPAPTIVWAQPDDITYGKALGSAQLDATASYAGSTVSGIMVYTPGPGTVLSAGANQTLSVTFTPADPMSFSPSTGTVSINVVPAPLTVTVNDANKLYGDPNPVFSAGIQGYVLNQTASVLSGTLGFSTMATSGSGVGGYTVSAGGLSAANYLISYVAGSLLVNPAPLLVTSDNQGRLYGAADPTFTGTLTGLKNNDPVSATYTTSADPTSDVGAYTVAVSLTDLMNRLFNYAVTTNLGALTINPVPLTVTPDNLSRTYGAATPTLTGKLSGLQNGDAISVGYSTLAVATSPLGSYDITAAPAGAKLHDYNVTNATGTLTITPAPLVVTPDDLTRDYGAVNPTLTGTIAGLQNNDPITATFAGSPDLTSEIGTYPITASLSDPAGRLGNYLVTMNAGTLSVSPAPLLVTPDDLGRLYAAANPTLTGKLFGLANGDAIAASYSTTAALASAVGLYPITATLSGPKLHDYNVTNGTGTLSVNPAPLVVTVLDSSRVYGAANPAFGANDSGFVLGQGASVLGGALTFSTPADATSPVGTDPVTASGLTAANYTITYVAGNLTITPASLVITPANANKDYGAPIPSLIGAITGLRNNDAITASYSTSAGPSSGVGAYAVNATLNDPTSRLGNYSVTTTAGTLTVTPAPLVVTVVDSTRVYGAANPAFGVSDSGFVLGEGASVLGGTLTFSTPAGVTSPVGTDPVTASGLTAANYAISYAAGKLTVTPAALTLTPDNASRFYGAANPVLTGTITGLQNNDPITATYASFASSTTEVGSAPITGALIDPAGRLTNYSVTKNSGTLTINPAPLSVTPDNLARLYAAAAPFFTGKLTGTVNGDIVTASYSTTAVAASPVGSYPITAVLSGAKLYDYNVTANTGTFTINPAPLVVTVVDSTKVYGAPNPAFSVSYQGFLLGQDASAVGGSPTYNTVASPASRVGTDAVTASGLTAANYVISYVAGTITITRASLAVTPDSPSRSYGAPNPNLTGTITGLQNNDPIVGIYATPAGPTSDVGAYPITAAFSDPAGRLGNYTVTTSAGSLTINPAPLSVTPDNLARLYGAANPTLTGTLSGVANGDAITASYSTSANASSPVGPLAITAVIAGAKLFDYTITAHSGMLTVTPAPLVVTVADSTKVYGAANPAFSVTYAGFVLGQDPNVLGGSVSYSTSADATSPVGTEAVAAAGLTADNYAITYVPGALTISRAPLTVTPDNQGRPYGAANPTLTGTITGLKNDDPITATYTTPANPKSDVGPYPIAAAPNDPAGLLGNYSLTTTTATLTIDPAPLSVTPDDLARPYGAANPALTGSLSGVENGDDLLAQYTTSADASSPAGPFEITAALFGAKLHDYHVTANTGTLTVAPAPLVVTVADTSKVYGAANPAFSVTYQGFVLGQNPSALTGSLTYSTPADPASPVGNEAVTASGLASANYAITYAAGNLSITPATLTVTPASVSKPYGVADPVLTGSVAGLQNGDAVTASYTTSADASSPVGSFAINATLNDPTSKLVNYTVTTNTGSLAVTPAPLVIAVVDASRVYGSPNPVFRVGYQGFVLGQDPSVLDGTLAYSTGADPTSPVGTDAVIASGLASANYAISYVAGKLTVSPAPLTVTPANASRVYGGANPALTGTITGLQNDDVISATYSTAANATSDAGGHDITATLSDPTNKLGNYSLSAKVGTLMITPALLTVTPDNAAKTYGDTAVLTGTIAGQQNGDAFTVTYASDGASAAADVASGSYPITVADVSGAMLADYTVVKNTGTLKVSPASLTVTADDATKVAGQANPAFTAHDTGFALGQGPDALAGSLSFQTTADASSSSGQYPITPSGLHSTNYSISYADGKLTVTPPLVTVQSVQWQTHKLSKKKSVKVLVVDYSGALEPGGAQNPANFHLTSAGKDKKFGTRDDKLIRIAAAAYNPAANMVTLTPAGKIPTGPLQLTVTASGLLDSNNRPLDGNRDGKPGGDFQMTLGG